MENYIVINGKKAELTKDQLEKLGIKIKKESPFERTKGDNYYLISSCGTTEYTTDNTLWDDERYCIANYCRDESLMQQRTLHETLDRLLWRFACENGELDNPWDGKSEHWFVGWDVHSERFYHGNALRWKSYDICFPSKEIAQRAIDEIVKPFMNEHPDFVW